MVRGELGKDRVGIANRLFGVGCTGDVLRAQGLASSRQRRFRAQKSFYRKLFVFRFTDVCPIACTSVLCFSDKKAEPALTRAAWPHEYHVSCSIATMRR
jgi:hypothetical protein